MSLLQGILLAVGSIVLILAIAVIVWARQVFPASQGARSGLDSTELVRVTRSEWISFEPRDVDPEVGIIFYPGGKAEPEAYAPILRRIAEHGVLAVLVPMPLNLALLGREKAAGVVPRFPGVRRWVIAGHSLGGAIACQYAARHPDQVAGLLLWAAFPGVETDLSASPLPMLTIVADADRLTTAAKLAEAAPRLPSQARSVSVPGADHWTFGDFAGLTEVSEETHRGLQEDIIEATIGFLTSLDPDGAAGKPVAPAQRSEAPVVPLT